jgi:hypothetical protein
MPTEYVRRLQTTSRPFEAIGVDEAGGSMRMCVKPRLTSLTSSTAMNAADLLGGVVGARLGVPVAEMGLAFVSEPFIAAVKPALDDVIPGWAVASRWIGKSFGLAHLGSSSSLRVSNPDSVAGVTVLDTMLQNNDRDDFNVLLEPGATRGARFRLRYIDQGWGMGAFQQLLSAGSPVSALNCYAPESDGLRELIEDQSVFLPYLFAAEALLASEIGGIAAGMISLGWELDQTYPDRVAEHLTVAVRHLRTVVLTSLSLFPRCH